MNSTMQFLAQHWRSVILVVGAVGAIYIVYKNRKKYIPEEDRQP
ncbi:hypothetical protein [Gordoniibacillus kamchatkensis]|nr:hypothetical protein [Paenibacillus sp. VKM B-2647]